jgi:hypothetical protein
MYEAYQLTNALNQNFFISKTLIQLIKTVKDLRFLVGSFQILVYNKLFATDNHVYKR